MTEYMCKHCQTIVPRGWRMQGCKCGKVAVDWSVDNGKHGVRLIFPGMPVEDHILEIDEGIIDDGPQE